MFVYHCAEGQPAARGRAGVDRGGERRLPAADLRRGARQRRRPDRVRRVDGPRAAIAWSPLSNLWLYGQTTDVPAARAAGVTVSLGSDWAPSGTKHVLGEVKSARLVSDHLGWELSDADLVRMVTCNPGDLLARPGAGSSAGCSPARSRTSSCIHAKPRADAFHTIVEGDRGRRRARRHRRPAALRHARADDGAPAPTSSHRWWSRARTDSCRSAGRTTRRTAWAWQDVVDRMEEVRADPKGEIEKAQAGLAAWAGAHGPSRGTAAAGAGHADRARPGGRPAQGPDAGGRARRCSP